MTVALLEPPVVADANASRRSSLTVEVANTAEIVQMALCIRAAVFIAEDNCPYREEFDGNDVFATHFVGFIDGEPAATMRVRYFGAVAKFERMAVLKRFRGSRVAFRIVDEAIEFVRRKGCTQITGHAQEGRERWWRLAGHRHGDGFTPIEGLPPFAFSGHGFTAMECTLPPHERALTLRTDPMVLNRPEGAWDRPGPLEWSAGEAGA